MANPEPEESASHGISSQINTNLAHQQHVEIAHPESGKASISCGHLASINDEEKAKEIANEDLQASRKQVGYSSPPSFLISLPVSFNSSLSKLIFVVLSNHN